jgi:hypothetical protein
MSDTVSAHSSSVAHTDDVAISQVVNGGPSNHTVAPEQLQSLWPTEMDLLTFPRMRKVMLTVQRRLMCTVIQDTFEQVLKALVFMNAFPDPFVVLEFTRDSLLAAADRHDRGLQTFITGFCVMPST